MNTRRLSSSSAEKAWRFCKHVLKESFLVQLLKRCLKPTFQTVMIHFIAPFVIAMSSPVPHYPLPACVFSFFCLTSVFVRLLSYLLKFFFFACFSLVLCWLHWFDLQIHKFLFSPVRIFGDNAHMLFLPFLVNLTSVSFMLALTPHCRMGLHIASVAWLYSSLFWESWHTATHFLHESNDEQGCLAQLSSLYSPTCSFTTSLHREN